MTNTERIQANNAELREAIEMAEKLPDAGEGGTEDLVDMLIENNGGLTSLVNDRVKKVNHYLCNQNANLVELDIPNVESVGNHAFRGCMITELNLPKCTSIGPYAFQSCTKIKTANLPELKTLGGYGLQSCGGLRSIVLPKVERLDTAALYGCWTMHTIDLHICTSISSTSIANCSVLTALILRSPTLCQLEGSGAFNNTPIKNSTGYIYVPKSLVDAYKSATNWSTYAAQIRAIEDYPEICGG